MDSPTQPVLTPMRPPTAGQGGDAQPIQPQPTQVRQVRIEREGRVPAPLPSTASAIGLLQFGESGLATIPCTAIMIKNHAHNRLEIRKEESQ